MSNKTKALILEIMLIQERYSSDEIERALVDVRNIDRYSELTDLIKLINGLSVKRNHSNNTKRKNARTVIPKSTLISRLKQGSQSVRYHLITEISKKMKIGEDFGGSRPNVDTIINAISEMNNKDYYIMMSKNEVNNEVDENFMELANFILKEK